MRLRLVLEAAGAWSVLWTMSFRQFKHQLESAGAEVRMKEVMGSVHTNSSTTVLRGTTWTMRSRDVNAASNCHISLYDTVHQCTKSVRGLNLFWIENINNNWIFCCHHTSNYNDQNLWKGWTGFIENDIVLQCKVIIVMKTYQPLGSAFMFKGSLDRFFFLDDLTEFNRLQYSACLNCAFRDIVLY